jgi:FlaA1/EpsC-like NDP-sugar epimerase
MNKRSLQNKTDYYRSLLERREINFESERLRDFICGKTVLITGAGGSIGSELAKQILSFNPQKLLLVERAEPALFDIDWELRQSPRETEIKPVLADIKDREYLERIFRTCRPQIIFHAAAHKHVPLMEENSIEAFRNNTLATQSLLELAGENDSEVFVFISTDKAIKPISVMGMTKFLAEQLVKQADEKFGTKYISVRFGNVFGSAGSVVPIFEKQIERGGPVTITHPDMTRYFMTKREAVNLVLRAGQMNHRNGVIYLLDMGEPVRIKKLAEEMIKLSGRDIKMIFTGIRPGEKITEEIRGQYSSCLKTDHPKIYVQSIESGDIDIVDLIESLSLKAAGSDNLHFKQELLRSFQSVAFSTKEPKFKRMEKSTAV